MERSVANCNCKPGFLFFCFSVIAFFPTVPGLPPLVLAILGNINLKATSNTKAKVQPLEALWTTGANARATFRKQHPGNGK